MTALRTLMAWFARPVLVFYLLPWLLVLLVLGTVAQRYIGLYHSEKLFFGSFWLWVGPVPLPGAYLTLLLLALSLLAKLVSKSPLRRQTLGTVITHASILLLLAGGLLSALTREEGYITLLKDQTAKTVADYHDREMVVFKNAVPVASISYEALSRTEHYQPPALPFVLKVKHTCYPCLPEPLPARDPQGYGIASAMRLQDALPSADDGANRAGAMLEVEGSKPEQNGTYLVFEMLNDPPPILIGEDRYTIEMRPASRPLPFTVKLLEYAQENHPGTAMAREYRSNVQVVDGSLQWTATISMNEPLRYRGYTIYQSSFIDNGEQTASVLAVVKNAGWLFPYASIVTLCVGLLLHLFNRMPGRKTGVPVAVASLLMVMALPEYSRADSMLDMEAFAHLPVLHEGRMKPLDSFARALWKEMSGEAHVKGYAATEWLAQTLVRPMDAMQGKVFAVSSPQLLQTLQLAKNETGRYSFNELMPLLAPQAETIRELAQRDAKTLSAPERELLRLYRSVMNYADLSGSLSLLMPIQDISAELRKALSLPDGELNYYRLQKVRHRLMDKLGAVVGKKQSRLADYTPLEQDITRLAYKLDMLEKSQSQNRLLRVIPGEWEDKEEWLSLWAVTQSGKGSPRSAALFSRWEGLLAAGSAADATAWNRETQALLREMNGMPQVRPHMLALEVMYNAVNPLGKSLILYGIAALLAMVAMASNRRFWFVAMAALTAAGIAVHGMSLLARMLILSRPPVSTLYESMIFVSFIVAICGAFLSLRRRQADGVLAGTAIAALVLCMADIFAGEGDTLEMLTAVLNTNFWLGTHVVCITAGYGFSLITAAMAHIYLARAAFMRRGDGLRRHARLLHLLALLALFFTTTGTMLGGIWADQSWGRFWGWDPKENGALAIVIWLIWALHGRVAGSVRDVGFAAVLGLTSIIVALAWIGVNLLSVGLHSYGFSNAAAWGLPVFCLTECIIIAMLAWLSARKRDL